MVSSQGFRRFSCVLPPVLRPLPTGAGSGAGAGAGAGAGIANAPRTRIPWFVAASLLTEDFVMVKSYKHYSTLLQFKILLNFFSIVWIIPGKTITVIHLPIQTGIVPGCRILDLGRQRSRAHLQIGSHLAYPFVKHVADPIRTAFHRHGLFAFVKTDLEHNDTLVKR